MTLEEQDIERLAPKVAKLMAEMPPKELYTPKEAAARYGVSVESIRKAAMRGDFGDLVWIAGKWRIRREEILSYDEFHTYRENTKRRRSREPRRITMEEVLNHGNH